jgi:hypothetical protein
LIQPRIEDYVKLESKSLEAALMAARQKDECYVTNIRNTYVASQNIRDVADSIGYSLIGFIATSLCTIIEATDAAAIECPAAIFDCYYQALRLALTRKYVKKSLKELPELSAGLLQTVHIVKGLAVRAADAKTSVAKQS